jgi:hypothetical protein
MSRFRNDDFLDYRLSNGFYSKSSMGTEVGNPLDRPPVEEGEVTQAYCYGKHEPRPHRLRTDTYLVYVAGRGYVALADASTIEDFAERELPVQWSLNRAMDLQFHDPVTGKKKTVKREIMQPRYHEDVYYGPEGRLNVTRENLLVVPSARRKPRPSDVTTA